MIERERGINVVLTANCILSQPCYCYCFPFFFSALFLCLEMRGKAGRRTAGFRVGWGRGIGETDGS